jgi:peptide/nickel transport system permease protein
VLHGARISLSIALLSVLMSLTVGTAVGMAAGYAGGITDTVLMRTVDSALAIPRIFLLVLVIALWRGAGVTALVLILTLGLTSWFETSRLVRAQVLSVKAREFVAASRALGLTPARILVRHILPSIQAPILVAGTLGVANMVLVEAGLSYLGLGMSPPTASLGNMISDGKDLLLEAPWIAVMPGLFVILTVLAFSVLSEGLREK